jgi:glyoxylate reductase
MAKPKVVVARMTPGLEESPIWERCEVWAWREDRVMPADLLREQAAGAEGLYVTSFDPVDVALLDQAPRLRVVSNYAVGVDNIDLAACTARGIAAGNTPGVVTEATADMAFALMLALSRRIREADAFVKARQWQTWSPTLMISNDVYGKTLGIIGMGRIGQAIARRAVGFRMPMLYHTRNPRPEAEQAYGCRRVSLEELLRQSDIVITIVPLTDATKHLINAAALAQMKESALLINVARGGVVDPRALHAALSAGRIRGAALDVTEPEPIPPDDPLLACENLLVAPHVATGTWETRRLMTDLAVKNLLAGLDGQPLLHCANPAVIGKERGRG